MAQIRCDRVGTVQVLTIDNETKRNAFSGSMAEELVGHLDQADQTPGVRCVVITGVGDKAFSSGHETDCTEPIPLFLVRPILPLSGKM